MKSRGSAMIYVLLTIPVLLTLAAFVINLSLSYTAIEQAKSYTRLLSLTALKQYYEVIREMNIDGSSQSENFLNILSEEVKQRVNSIARENKFTGHKEEEFLDFIFPWETSNGPNGGMLIPGTYYFTNPNNMPGCDLPPCFIPIDSASLNDPASLSSINAFKIEANYVDSLKAAFLGSFLGNPVQELKTCAFSTAVKRNVMFMIDISGSSVADTHIRRIVEEQVATPEEGRGGRYAFPIDQIYAPLPPGENNNNCYTTSGGSEFGKTSYCYWHFIKNYTPLDPPGAGEEYEGPAENRQVGDTNVLKHYYHDFVDAGGPEVESRFLVEGPQNDGVYAEPTNKEDGDMHPLPADFPNTYLVGKEFFIDRYTNPEPLTSIFNAMTVGIEELIKRNVPGDKAGYIFFEKTLTWSRIVNLTQETNYLSDIATNDTRNYSGQSYKLRDKLGIFPSGLITEDFTDVYVALKEAVRQLKENKVALNGAPSSDDIIYVGDFLPNCVAKKYIAAHSSSCSTCQPSDPVCTDFCNQRDCWDDYEHFSLAINEIWDLVSEEIIPNKISLNVILLGKDVGPHTMDIEHPDPAESGRCLTDPEARKQGLDYMRGGNYAGAIPADWDLYYKTRGEGNPFYQAGYEGYKMVRATGGIFKSVLASPDNCVPDDACIDGLRRVVDRQCRTTQEQLSGYLTEIVGAGNPFKIVNTSCEFGS